MRPLHAVKGFVERYQHQLSISAFLVGFTIDTIVLKRIDLLISHVLILSYLSVVVVVMLLLHRAAARPPRFELVRRVYQWLPFAAQFAFGGMFSGFLIFYSQAGSFIASWPFLLVLVALILTNEYLRSYQWRLTYQSTLLFFCVFTFSIYALPILMGRMGDGVFELSGVLALVGVSGFLWLLYLVDGKRVRMSLSSIVTGVLIVYASVTALYYSNILPPIPLALKDIGVYHRVVKLNDQYHVATESQPWHARVSGVVVTSPEGGTLFAYSSVFAPTRLITSIVHRWEYYDTQRGLWVTAATIPFSIFGGRDGGYRGYSEYGPVTPGEWRVSVETVRGQLIGRETFTVRSGSTPTLESRILR
jgi:hypothetical protein